MTRNALGTLIRSTAVTATTTRPSHMLAARKSTTGLPATTTSTTSPPVRTARIGTTVKMIFPARVNRPKERATAVTGRAPGGRCGRWRLRARAHAHPSALARVLAGALASTRPARASFVHPSHDRVEARHHRHGVGDQVARHQHADRLQVDERRVVD